ncbi:hypothetical protein LTR08_000071 [Meristemomyces frigidus]|nr:hypothetical protein LTR08_000071 [Meristemomyces frigidus]
MASLASAVSAPLLLLLTLPLAFFAILTTTLAFWVLLFRVSLIYIELLTTLLRAYLTPPQLHPLPLPTPFPPTPTPRSRRPSRSSSTTSPHPLTLTNPKAQSSTTLYPRPPERDYEGVGGWRLQASTDEETLWLSINSRLELPAAQTRRHQRSLTGSRAPSGFASPEMLYTPIAPRSRDAGSGAASSGLEGYFGIPLRGGSEADYGARVSVQKHARGGSSRATSSGSVVSSRQALM